jgi:hypothetical protein
MVGWWELCQIVGGAAGELPLLCKVVCDCKSRSGRVSAWVLNEDGIERMIEALRDNS